MGCPRNCEICLDTMIILFYGLPIGNENLFQWQLAKYETLWSVLNFEYVILFFGQFQVMC
jgi:hypothetical protein